MSSGSGSKAFRVLVIDDEPMSLKVLHHLMQSLGAEQIATATSYAEARAALVADPSLKLIVSDHYMKDGNGIRLLGDVRQGLLPVPNDTYFIISTSSKSFALGAVAMMLHVDSFMSKPFAKEELARRLYDFVTNDSRAIEPKEHYQQLKIDEMIAAAEAKDPARQLVASLIRPKNLEMTPLNKVFPDSVLVADLTDAEGGMLLRSGTTLSRHILKRLAELGVQEVPVAKA